MKKPNGRACAIIRAISYAVSETSLRFRVIGKCEVRAHAKIATRSKVADMKLWPPKRVAANSQARRERRHPACIFALRQCRLEACAPGSFLVSLIIILAAVSMLLASTYSNRSFSQQQALTFTRDVAPIFYKRCAACHQPEDIAPFSVLDYEDVLPWKNSIREKVAAREMPPWHADPHYGDFANVARLSQQEIDTIVNWVGQGAKQGDPKD